MDYENALNFLLYSYFGIDGGVDRLKQGNYKEIVVLCARRAYLDLSRTVKYKYTSTELESKNLKISSEEKKSFQKSKAKVINDICNTILNDVEGDKIHCCDDAFTEWHEKKCDDIIGQMKQATYKTSISENNKIIEEDFTYGQAQKWLNMTLKYLWLLDLLPDGLTKKSLHVPIDSYIIEAVKSKDEAQYGLGIDNELSKTSWSTWNVYEKYKEYQDSIKEKIKELYPNLSPIEWEGKAWIEIAKKNS